MHNDSYVLLAEPNKFCKNPIKNYYALQIAQQGVGYH